MISETIKSGKNNRFWKTIWKHGKQTPSKLIQNVSNKCCTSVLSFVGLVGLVLSFHSTLLVFSWVQNIFSWVFRGSNIFSSGYFVGVEFFSGYTWVRNFLSWVFFASECFSEFFVSSFFLLVNFVIQRFYVAGCMSKSNKKRNTKIHLKPSILF